MKITKELVEKYAGKTYDDGLNRGIISGFDSDEDNRCVVLSEATHNGKDCYETESTSWGDTTIIFKHWEGKSSIVWIYNFDIKHIVEEDSQYTYMELDNNFEYPTWWDATKPPILCWVSDENGEDPEQAYVCGIEPNGRCAFQTVNGYGTYQACKYATPVATPSKEEQLKTSKLEALRETMRVAKEQIDEILRESK